MNDQARQHQFPLSLFSAPCLSPGEVCPRNIRDLRQLLSKTATTVMVCLLMDWAVISPLVTCCSVTKSFSLKQCLHWLNNPHPFHSIASSLPDPAQSSWTDASNRLQATHCGTIFLFKLRLISKDWWYLLAIRVSESKARAMKWLHWLLPSSIDQLLLSIDMQEAP